MRPNWVGRNYKALVIPAGVTLSVLTAVSMW